MSEPSDMSTWRSGGKPTDIVIEIGDRTFDCHRDALTSDKGPFSERWNGGIPEEICKIRIPEEIISADAFEYALIFIYDEDPDGTTAETVYHELRAAHFLKRPRLLQSYESIMQKILPCSFMFDAMTFARTSGRWRLWSHIADYASLQLEGLCETYEFLELPLDDIKMIIELSPLDEDIVKEAVVKWINHNREVRWRHFNELSRLGVMTGVSSFQMKSIAKSILPDEIPRQEVLSFLNSLESTSVDKSLMLVWGTPMVKPSPRKGPYTSLVEVTINHSIQSRMIETGSRITRMKRVALDKSSVYQLNFRLLPGSKRCGILEFFSYTPGAMELEKNKLTPPSTRDLMASHYDHFQMCGLRSTKRIYLWADCAKDLRVYDCDANQWETLYFEKALKWATMTACDTNNAVYLLGGDKHNDAYLFALDPSTKEWSVLSQPFAKKYSFGTEMCALKGKLYIYHRTYRAYGIYDPKRNEWADSSKNPYANVPPTQNVTVYADELWLFSAASRKLAEKQKQRAYMAYLYLPESNCWRAYPAMIPAIKKYEKNARGPRLHLLDAIEV